MRTRRGFTLLELMVVVAILALAGALIVRQGWSSRQNADLTGGIYDLVLRIQGLKGRAMSEGTDYLLVMVDSEDVTACHSNRDACARFFVLRNPLPTFDLTAFDPDAPYADAERDDADTLPRGAVLDIGSSWTPPAPYGGVTAWDSTIRKTCDGRICFAFRFTDTGEVVPEPRLDPYPGGFTFVVSPASHVIQAIGDSRAAERRAVFVSFPAGIVKTVAF